MRKPFAPNMKRNSLFLPTFLLLVTVVTSATIKDRGQELLNFLNDAFDLNQPPVRHPEELTGLVDTPETSDAPAEVCTTPSPADDSTEISTTPGKTSPVLTDIIEAMSKESSNSVEATDGRELDMSAESGEDWAFGRGRKRSTQKDPPPRQENNSPESADNSAELTEVPQKKDVVEERRPAERPDLLMDQDVSSQELDKAVEKKDSEKVMGKGPGPKDGGSDRKPAGQARPPRANPRAVARPLSRPSASEAVNLNVDSAETVLDAPDQPDLNADNKEFSMTQQRQGRRAGLQAGSRDRDGPARREPATVARSGEHPGPLRRSAVHTDLPVLMDRDSAETRELPDALDLDTGSREVTIAQVRKRVRSLPLSATTSSAKSGTPKAAGGCRLCVGQVTRGAPEAGESTTTPPTTPDAEPESAECTTELHPQHHKSPAGPITTRRMPSDTTADKLETDSMESLRDNSTEGYVNYSDTFAMNL